MLLRAPVPVIDYESPPRTGVETRANVLASLVGPAYQANPNTAVRAELLTDAATLEDMLGTINGAIDEAFADKAETTLSRYEAVYGLTSRPDWGVERRRMRVLATIRAMRGGTVQAILRAVQAYDPAARVYETTFQDAVNAAYIGVGDAPNLTVPRVADTASYYGGYRNVWTLGVRVNVWAWTRYYQDIVDVIEAAKPAHVSLQLGVDAPFIVGEADGSAGSLLDRDLLTGGP